MTTQATLVFWLHMMFVGILNELLVGLGPFLQQNSTSLSVSRLVNYRIRPKAAVRSLGAHASYNFTSSAQLTAPFLLRQAGSQQARRSASKRVSRKLIKRYLLSARISQVPLADNRSPVQRHYAWSLPRWSFGASPNRCAVVIMAYRRHRQKA